MTIKALTIVPARFEDRDSVVELWNACGLVVPHNPPVADFDFASGKENSDILAGWMDDRIVATAMVGHDGHRGWLYYLAVDSAFRRSGLGEQIVRAAEAWLRERGVRKMQLMVRESNSSVVDFYNRIGYERSPVVVMQRWLDKE
jgi:ribosomal protein S18 acetylase RimI-like enzyme